MKRRVLPLLFLLLIPMLASADQSPQYARLQILYTNDLYGHLFPFRWDNEDNVGGFERMATVVRQIRAESKDPVLLFDAGDLFMRGPLEMMQGKPDIAVMNAMGYNAAAVGDRDFMGGARTESEYTPFPGSRDAEFPLLCANLLWRDTGKPVLRPWTIVQAGRLKVAVFGLIEPTFSSDGMEVADPITIANELMPMLRSQADVIVALTHIGYKKEQELAKAVPDIDVVVGGGGRKETTSLEAPLVIPCSGESRPFWIGGPVIVQDGLFGVTLGHLMVDLRRSDDQSYRVMSCSVQLHKITHTLPPAVDITAILKQASAPFDKRLGMCSRDIIPGPERGDDVELWIAEVMRRAARADICVHSFDADESLRKGMLTRLDIRKMLPYCNTLARVKMTPAQFQQAVNGCHVTISGVIPPGAETITVATEDYFATHLTAAGGRVDFTGKEVSSEIEDYISSMPSVGDEVAPAAEPAKADSDR